MNPPAGELLSYIFNAFLMIAEKMKVVFIALS